MPLAFSLMCVPKKTTYSHIKWKLRKHLVHIFRTLCCFFVVVCAFCCKQLNLIYKMNDEGNEKWKKIHQISEFSSGSNVWDILKYYVGIIRWSFVIGVFFVLLTFVEIDQFSITNANFFSCKIIWTSKLFLKLNNTQSIQSYIYVLWTWLCCNVRSHML